MLNKIIKELNDRGYEKVEMKEITKNGVKMKGVVIFDSKKIIAPIIYVDSILQECKDVRVIVNEIEKIYKESESAKLNLEFFSNKDLILEKARIGIQRESQEEIVKEKTDYEGIEKYIYVNISEEEESSYSFKLRKEQIDVLGLVEREIWKRAEKNTFKTVQIRPMTEIMSEITGRPIEEDKSMLVVSTKESFKGAVAILDKTKIKKAVEQLYGKNFPKKWVILPSSIHEVIIVPLTFGARIEDFDLMVQEVNEAEVIPTEQLSDRAFLLNL